MSKEVKLDYGYDFQIRVLYLLMYDPSFFITINSILDPDYFDNELISWVARTIIKYHRKHKIIITKESLDVEFKDATIPFSELDYNKLMRDVKEVEYKGDLEYTANKILDFCKRQNMKSAILDSAGLLQGQQESDEDLLYDKIYSIIKSAVSAGEPIDNGYDYYEEIDRRYSEDARNPIPTGWGPVDELMDGGLAAGELGVFVCPPKGGKSWLMVSSAVHAATIGKKVLFITLELSSSYVGRRFDANIIQTPVNETKNYTHLIKQELDARDFRSKVRIKKFNKPNIYKIENFIQSLREQGFVPDIIFVDYADLIRGENKDLRMVLRGVYEDLRALGDDFKVPIWTASQSNRQSTNAEIITKDLIAEDFSKIMTADFILSLSSKDLFYVMANRFGKDEVSIEASKVDKSCGVFEMLGVVDLENKDSNNSGNSGKNGSVYGGLSAKEMASLFDQSMGGGPSPKLH